MGSRRSVNLSNERMSRSVTDVNFASYESIMDVDQFKEPEMFPNFPWFAPFYQSSEEPVNQYVIVGILPGLLPVKEFLFRELDLRFVITSDDIFQRSG